MLGLLGHFECLWYLHCSPSVHYCPLFIRYVR
jgi:hypothetical protein